MNCEDFKNLMIINIYGKLTSQEKSEFDNHLIQCSDCTAKFEKLKRQENILENSDLPEPDWEKSWEIIAQKSIRRKIEPREARNTRKYPIYFHLKKVFVSFVVYLKNDKKSALQKYALSAAILILVFMIGFSVGRKFFVTQPETQLTSSITFSNLSLQTFAEDLEPILIDFLNRSGRPIPDEFADFEKKIVSEMLVKTRILKYVMQKRENTQLVQLLDDIEFILLNLSNLRPEDSLSTKQIQQFIREKNLKYQLKLVASVKLTG